ncbi:GNAT family N-acetyltransferase [Ereboglobus luteus]|uniref:N-acetyltransferase domain-containing protein n=1 Tax=Ereboglobus luteus TaxID=1796921 RepID=A0A2U8E550_9BACT|nr:GNAT family N-acetyltransferase [Ereboglobus luteus]AWI09885.1 hypothetical protein CKA38_12055 [Ereboglobus luteus]
MNDTNAHEPVRHNAAKSRYELTPPNAGEPSVLEYVLEPQTNRMIFTHTFVPPEMRGKGVAEKLVHAALADARAQGRRVDPQCSYVAKFIELHHAEFGNLLA